MSWRLRVKHRTGFTYAGTVHASYNEVRMSPLDTPTQFTIEHRLDVAPAAHVSRYRDYWGTRVHVFDLHRPHTELMVTATSLVETPAYAPEPASATVPWETYTWDSVTDRYCEYLSFTDYVSRNDDLDALARQLRGASTPGRAVADVVEMLHSDFAYVPGSTNVTTSATEVLAHKRGVCQDFAHLGIALLRSMGIPARYASGYLHPQKDALIDNPIEGQSHAWLEAWLGDWHAVDPTNGTAVASQHVLVARGRDYGDVPPLKGIYNGGPSDRVDVQVEITRVG